MGNRRGLFSLGVVGIALALLAQLAFLGFIIWAIYRLVVHFTA